MIARGAGHVVNVASAAGLVPIGGLAAYSANKPAVVALSQALSSELAAQGVTVSVICPSVVRTGISRRMRVGDAAGAADRRARAEHLTQGTDLTPEHVARAVLNALRSEEELVLLGRDTHLLDVARRCSRRLAQGLVSWAERRLR
jgi:short-subunit dehydrogenase